MSLLPPTLPLYHEKFPYTISLQWRKIFSFVLSLRVSFSANWTYCSRFFFLPEITPRIFPARSRSSAWTKQCRDQRIWRSFRFTKKRRWVCLTSLGSLLPWSLLLEFEDGMNDNPQSEPSRTKHHEDNENFRKNFVGDVKILCKELPWIHSNKKRWKSWTTRRFHSQKSQLIYLRVWKGEQDVFAFISNSTSF